MCRITTTITSLSLAVFLAASLPVQAKDLGTFGAMYPIAEPDALAEMKAKAARVDWKKYLDREKLTRRVREYRPKDLERLPAAGRDRTFLADMTYTLDMDIPDGKGGILYPKGYTFNPLDFVTLDRTLVIIDGSDARQVEWFRKSAWRGDVKAMLLLTGGNWYRVEEKLKRPVFYADRRMVAKLGLKAVPAVAVQKGRYMEVREYGIR
jgi:conjugal transfer pilus assembly protein TraW